MPSVDGPRPRRPVISDKTTMHELRDADPHQRTAHRVDGYHFTVQPKEYVERRMQGISPFEMELEAIEGKFKLGQERSEVDRNGVLRHLEKENRIASARYQLTSAFYKRSAK